MYKKRKYHKLIKSRLLLNRTIESISYEKKKHRIIFKMDNDFEVSMYIDPVQSYEDDELVTKNREKIDYHELENIYVNDIGWCSFNFNTVSRLFIVDHKKDTVYRIPCSTERNSKLIMGLYDHTAYKEAKAEVKRKKEKRRNRRRELFARQKN